MSESRRALRARDPRRGWRRPRLVSPDGRPAPGAGGARPASRLARLLASALVVVALAGTAGAEEPGAYARLYLQRLDSGQAPYLHDGRDGWYSILRTAPEWDAWGAGVAGASPETGLPGLEFDTSFRVTEPPAGVPAEPSWTFFRVNTRASSRLFQGTLTEHLEVMGYDFPDHAEAATMAPTAPRLFRLGVTGQWGWFDTGLRGRSVTAGLEKLAGPGARADEEGAKAWMAARLSALRLEASAEAFHDNVWDDPERPRTHTTQAGLTMELALGERSRLSLGAARGQWARTPAPREPGPDDPDRISEFDSLSVTLYGYGGETWDVSLGSTLTLSAPRGVGGETSAVTHDLSGTYRAIPNVTLVPSVSLTESGGAATGAQSLTASLTLMLAQVVEDWDLSLYAGYSRNRTADQAFDGRSVDGIATVVWTLRRSAPRTTLALEVGYHRYADSGSAFRYEEAVALVTLRVASF